MRITVKGKEHDFDAGTITNREAMDLERATGLTFGQWNDALKERSALAMTGMVWLVLRREEPALRFDAVEFTFSDLSVASEEDAAVDPTEETEGGPSTSEDESKTAD